MKPAELDRRVNLYTVLQKTWGINQMAAENLINHGHVRIDGHVVQKVWAKNHWTVRQLRGRMLSSPRGQVRLFGSRPDRGEPVNEQLQFGSR
jgi:hypothetical protein